MTTAARTLAIEDWGRTHYGESTARQEALLALRIADEAPDTLVFTEHAPVYTIGRHPGAAQHLLWNEDNLRAQGIEVHRTARGGDITYHGPGQVVGYPIISLNERRDLHRYLRDIEEVLIRAAGTFGLAASRREGMTGIWLGQRKLAAIGVAVKRWVTWHGFAFNVAPDLAHFAGIVPCGITAGTVTSLAAELGAPPEMAEAREVLAREFRRVFGYPA